MNKLTSDEMEEIKEIYEWGYFMKSVMEYKKDAASNDLSDDIILSLIEAENNLEMFSDYQSESNPCEMCGSHGSVSVLINGTRVVMKEW